VSRLSSRFREVGHLFVVFNFLCVRGVWTKVSVPGGRPFFPEFAFHSWLGVSRLRSRFREVGHLFLVLHFLCEKRCLE
jgi:hypothetical protein